MPSGIQHFVNIHISTNDAQELMPYKFEFKSTQKESEKISSVPRFEPKTLEQTTDALDKSATAGSFFFNVVRKKRN
jgi:hypothetical protein